jgi:hypothetical protein
MNPHVTCDHTLYWCCQTIRPPRNVWIGLNTTVTSMASSQALTKIVIPSYAHISADERCLVLDIAATIKHFDLRMDWLPKCFEVAIDTKGKSESDVIDQLRRLFGESHKNVWIAIQIRKAAEPLDLQPPRSPRFEAVYASSSTDPPKQKRPRKTSGSTSEKAPIAPRKKKANTTITTTAAASDKK